MNRTANVQKQRKVLVVEDETYVRANIQEILELEGYQVIATGNGSTGVQLARTERPDLLICDLTMPRMDGYDLLAVLRQDPLTASIPVIILTAKAERSDQRLAMELGADDYITKPFDPSELLRAIAIRFEKQTLVMKQYLKQHEQAEKLEGEVRENQQQIQASLQLAEMRGSLVQQLCQELRNPLSSISMAIQMLKEATSDAERDRYLKVLKEAYDREVALLSQGEQLQGLLSMENLKTLKNKKISLM